MFDAKTAPDSELADALKIQAAILQYWLTWNKRLRDQAAMSTDDGTAIITVPPHWPTHGQFRVWSETMAEAASRLNRKE